VIWSSDAFRSTGSRRDADDASVRVIGSRDSQVGVYLSLQPRIGRAKHRERSLGDSNGAPRGLLSRKELRIGGTGCAAECGVCSLDRSL
jgi:hypothetical protein